MSSSSSLEVIENEELFDKHRGQRRWLGKEHHRGKDKLYDSVKDRVLIQKTIKSSEPLSKKSISKIANSTSDDFGLNVYYSIDKKNRWKDTKNADLLRAAPSDVDAEVVEKNILSELGFAPDKKTTFSVHSKIDRNSDELSGFQIRSSTCAGPGQHYSNFLPESRELSKKTAKKGQKQTEWKEEVEFEPTVTYNIFKAHRSKDVVGGQMMEAKSLSKTGKHRANKKMTVQKEMYDNAEDFEFSDDEEHDFYDSDGPKLETVDLSQYIVESKKQQRTKRASSSSANSESFEFVNAKFEKLFNIQQHLNQAGYTFIETDVLFPNMSNIKFQKEVKNVVSSSNLSVRFLNSKQVLIDASKWSHQNGNFVGETSLLIQVTKTSEKTLHILINSTLATNPSNRSSQHIRELVSSSKTLLEAISRICRQFVSNREIIESMKDRSKFVKTTSFFEMINKCSEWKTKTVNIPEPNRESWACSKEILSTGVKQEWNHICETVRETYTSHATTSSAEKEIPGSSVCSECTTNQPTYNLFHITDGTRKCRDCLKKAFNSNFELERLPIDLEIADPTSSNLNTFDFLPTIIPLPIFNMYTRKLFQNIYNDLGASGAFDQCDICKSTSYFEDNSSSDRACSCGFSWCSGCRSVPHWPMACEQFSSWDNKWSRRYDVCQAQGSGNDTLMSILCECQAAAFNVRLPTETAECPACHKKVELETMDLVYKGNFFKWEARYRKYVYACYKNPSDLYRCSMNKFEPVEIKYTPIAKIPQIKKSVVEICSAARSKRLDENYHREIHTKENELIKKGVLKSEDLENITGSVLYLAENVTGWMYISNCFDRNIRKALDSLMQKREEMMIMIESDNLTSIEKCIENITKDTKSIIKLVEETLCRTELEQDS